MEQNKVNYSKHIVAFLDVLGFREMVYEGKTEKIEKYFNISKIVRERLLDIDIKKEIKFISFSDSIVAFLELDSPSNQIDNFIKLREFLIALSILQGELALESVWLRGGVAIGDLKFDNHQYSIFGPGLIKAYDLESRHAKYPRIIIDQEIISYFNRKSFSDLIYDINKNDGKEWKHSVLFNWRQGLGEYGSFRKDYPLFIDYANQFMNQQEGHKLDVLAGLLNEESKKNPIAYEKFRWTADYINISYKLANFGGPTEQELFSGNLSSMLNRF